MKCHSILLSIVIVVFTACSKDEEEDKPSLPDPTLAFLMNGNVVNTLSLSGLKSNLDEEDISIFDHVHQKNKNYRAFPLDDVLEYAYGSLLDSAEDKDFLFKALDGYQVTASYDTATEDGGYLAFEDLDVSGSTNWEPVARENNNDPAPYYIVWSGSGQNPTTDGYPWPYQLSQIDLTD